MLPLLLTTALLGQADAEPAIVPKGAAPIIRLGHIEKGNFVTQTQLMQAVPVTEQRTVNVGGKQETVTVTSYVYQAKTVNQTLDLSKATATTAGGKKLDKDALARRLAKPAAVVWSADGKPVDKGYLAMFKPDTVVIVVPAAAMPVPGAKTLEKK